MLITPIMTDFPTEAGWYTYRCKDFTHIHEVYWSVGDIFRVRGTGDQNRMDNPVIDYPGHWAKLSVQEILEAVLALKKTRQEIVGLQRHAEELEMELFGKPHTMMIALTTDQRTRASSAGSLIMPLTSRLRSQG